MLTHHLQDHPNGNIMELLRQAGAAGGSSASFSLISSKFQKLAAGVNGLANSAQNAANGTGDMNENSFNSESKKQAKIDKIEQEISRLINRGGPLFIVEQFGRNGNSKDDSRSAGYFSDDDLLGNGNCNGGPYGVDKIGDKPIFKIKFKPRQSCHLH